LSAEDEKEGRVALPGNIKHFSYLEDLAGPIKNVIVTAWASRGKLARDVKTYILVTSNAVISMPGRASKVIKNPKIHAVLAEEEDMEALAAVVCGTGAGLCAGSIGAVVGGSLGGVGGVAVGAVPALFTLGLSLPIGLVIGGTGGACTGMVVGSSVGFAGGGVSGAAIAYYRVEIVGTVNGVMARVDYVYDRLVYQPTMKVKKTTKTICDKTKKSTAKTKECLQALVSSRHAQVTAATGAVGAAALGTAGATGGALAGGAAGAAIGLVPALFTFGLSIPVCAVIGGGMGGVAGGAAGATTGLAGGAGCGYVGYACRNRPAQAIEFAREKWNGYQGIKPRARSSSGGTSTEGSHSD